MLLRFACNLVLLTSIITAVHILLQLSGLVLVLRRGFQRFCHLHNLQISLAFRQPFLRFFKCPWVASAVLFFSSFLVLILFLLVFQRPSAWICLFVLFSLVSYSCMHLDETAGNYVCCLLSVSVYECALPFPAKTCSTLCWVCCCSYAPWPRCMAVKM